MSGRQDNNEEIVDAVRVAFHRNARKSNCVTSNELAIRRSTVYKVLHKRIQLHAYKLQIFQVSENASKRLINEILCADDLVLMNKSIENLKEKFSKWKEAFESKGLKVNLKKIKVMVIGSKDEVLKSKVDSYPKCGKRVMANSMRCTKCGKWVHGRCSKRKRVTSTLQKVLFVNYVLIQRKECWTR